MVLATKRSGALVLRLIVGLALLGCARVVSAQGTWSVISLPLLPGQVDHPSALVRDGAGSLYVADQGFGIQKRDAQGNWSLIAARGTGLGQVSDPSALAADAAGNLYVAEGGNGGRLQKRDGQGHWSVIAAQSASALAVDSAGNLYVADYGRIQKRNAQGNWSIIATDGTALGQVGHVPALAVDTAGNLYVAQASALGIPIQKRDAQGRWSTIATSGTNVGKVVVPTALAVDTADNLYVADGFFDTAGLNNRIQKRDSQGNWSGIVTGGDAPGQVGHVSALAVDTVGNLYSAENSYDSTGSLLLRSRIQKRDAMGHWSVVATGAGDVVGQVVDPAALTVDAASNLYVADRGTGPFRILKRNTQGNWSVLAELCAVDTGPSLDRRSLAADGAGNIYMVLYLSKTGLIVRRDAQGNWSVLATVAPYDNGYYESGYPFVFLAGDSADNLYVAFDQGDSSGIARRAPQGNWSTIATFAGPLAVDGTGSLYVEAHGDILRRDSHGDWSWLGLPYLYGNPLAADTAGNLYVAYGSQIQKRDAHGNWSVIATEGSGLGQVGYVSALAVDGAGNLYVADNRYNRILKYTLAP